MKPTLVILAAGMGSRFGGLKQTEPVGPNGEFIIDYSIYDAVAASFGKVVFVIRREFEDKFRATIGSRAARVMEVDYAFQELGDLPDGIDIVPAGRAKPWGTGHAVYCARGVVNGSFAVINADDFYGRQAYEGIRDFLAKEGNSEICMAGYYIQNTLTENGSVSRGLCESDEDGYLIEITERLNISRKGDKIVYTENSKDFEVAENTYASMNFFGFPEGAMNWFDDGVRKALLECRDIMTAEVYLPAMVTHFIHSGLAKAKVLATDEKWYGVTYSKDLEYTRAAIAQLVKDGRYRERLWDDA